MHAATAPVDGELTAADLPGAGVIGMCGSMASPIKTLEGALGHHTRDPAAAEKQQAYALPVIKLRPTTMPWGHY